MILFSSNTIKKCKLDDRKYKFILLQNGMKCLLVRDKELQKSAACLYVGSGNLTDPIE